MRAFDVRRLLRGFAASHADDASGPAWALRANDDDFMSFNHADYNEDALQVWNVLTVMHVLKSGARYNAWSLANWLVGDDAIATHDDAPYGVLAAVTEALVAAAAECFPTRERSTHMAVAAFLNAAVG